MQLQSFRVRQFRNIEDSGQVDLLSKLTCVVGKNQSGKSALLRALHKFNPHRDDPYDMRRDWPRGHRSSRSAQQVVCEASFKLAPDDSVALAAFADRTSFSETHVLVTRDYAGTYAIRFPENPDLLPDPQDPTHIESICAAIPRPIGGTNDNFREAALTCILEAEECVKEGRFVELADLQARHKAQLEEHPAEGGQTPLQASQEAFIAQYSSHLGDLHAKLNGALAQYRRACTYIVNRLPTFIYMDDYRSFRGRAVLDSLRERRNAQSEDLSEEDATFLMILRLAGLNLDELINQGQAGSADILHDRQMDLQDAAKTLTRNIAGRWGQNEYQVQFRVDGQTFFTEIEETDKNIGMIPLEEQSKGFQWFFSFDLHFMHDSEGTFENCVLLLDEPGLHLHPGGQEDLLERLDAYAKKNTLIYTTHLPFLVDLRDPKRIKVIHQTDAGAVVSSDLGASQTAEKFTLQAALGMRAKQSFFVAKRNLLVEGVSDYWLIAELSRIFEREDRVHLAEDVMITAAGSASEIVPMATFMIGQELDVVALFDSDSAGEEAEKKLRENWITCY